MKAQTKQRFTNGFSNLVSLVQKNIKVLLRARASALIVIIGPLFVIFLAGLAFDNTDLYAIRVGAYSPVYNDLSNSFLEKLSEHGFMVVRYPERAECVDSIRKGEIHTCLLFSPNFTIGESSSNQIEFYVDYSRLNLVWTVLNVMSKSISARTRELSKNLTEALLNALEFANEETFARKSNIITLATINDEIGRRAASIEAELGEIELNLNPDEFGVDNLSSAKGKVKHWVDNSISIAKNSLSQSLSFIDAAGELVQGSAAGNEISDPLLEAMKDSADDIRVLKERLDTTEELAQQEFAELESIINHLSGKITQTKAQLDVADSARVFTLDEIAVIQKLLDNSLLNILTVQKTLDEVQAVMDSVEIVDSESIIQPIQTSIKPVVSERSYLNYLFPTLLALVIMFTALLLAPILIMLEKNSPAAFRNFMTPAGDGVFVLSAFITTAFLLVIQVAIILAIASIFFTQLLASFIPLVLNLLLIITIFTLLGMLVGYVFNSEETAILGAISLGSLMLFISNIIIPLESMPTFLLKLAQYNPLVISAEILRRTTLFGAGLADTTATAGLLGLYVIVAAGLVILVYMMSKKHALKKYFAKFRKQ